MAGVFNFGEVLLDAYQQDKKLELEKERFDRTMEMNREQFQKNYDLNERQFEHTKEMSWKDFMLKSDMFDESKRQYKEKFEWEKGVDARNFDYNSKMDQARLGLQARGLNLQETELGAKLKAEQTMLNQRDRANWSFWDAMEGFLTQNPVTLYGNAPDVMKYGSKDQQDMLFAFMQGIPYPARRNAIAPSPAQNTKVPSNTGYPSFGKAPVY